MSNSPDFWTKSGDRLDVKNDLSWNFPEQKSGTLMILGGNSSAFSTEVKLAEFLNKKFPFLKTIKNLFPDSLKSKFPPLENLEFFESSESGSFKKSSELSSALKTADFVLISGDLSKNSETAVALSAVLKENPDIPTLLTRDAVDLLAPEAEAFLDRENLFLVASLTQLQKLLRAVYYPKMLLLSSPIFPVVETLHKFTLSYPVGILTFHEGEILCAKDGKIISIPLEKTNYSPISLWSGEVAAKFAVNYMFNPKKPLDCLVASVL